MIAYLLLTGESKAVTGTYCAKYAIDYTDVNSVDSALGDDEFLTNGDKIARGATMTFSPNGPGPLPFSVTLNGSGCTTQNITNAVTWQIKIKAEATVDGNSFDVRNNQSGNAVWVGTLETAWTPTTGTHNMTTNNHEAWNIMATVGWALESTNGGESGHTMTFFTEECPDIANVSCERFPNIFIEPDAFDNKYIIAHELGHAMMEMCNNERDENLDPGGGGGDCDGAGGDLELKEFASNAANEGVAWYYAAMVFNDRGDDDCEFANRLDYDENSTFTAVERAPSCEGDPGTEPWVNLDYLGGECSGTLTERAVRFDYVRAFWDLTQNAPGNGQGLLFADVCDLWLEARPDTWDADGGSANDDPADRFLDAADDLLFLTEWNNVDNANGIHR